jgi:hypothetical protein
MNMTNEAPGARTLTEVTGESVDPRFDEPSIHAREWRDTPVRHLYVHGAFTGTNARFSFYFPPPGQFDGRFYQITHQLFFSEETDPYNIGMAAAGCAYFVQTNMGGAEYPRMARDALSGRFDPSVGGYRVNAAAAKFSKVVAREVYGWDESRRIYGYLYGGSGGAFQTITSAEVTHGVWDGFLPFVMGSPNAIPNVFTLRVHALQLLKDKWPSIIDAVEPGGSGDPYAELNDEQRGALEEATRGGFPLRAWFNYVPMGGGPLRLVAGYVPIVDPAYVDDFWAKPGYLGTDPSSSVREARVQYASAVVTVITGPPAGLELSSVPAGDLTGAELIIMSGAAAGESLPIGTVDGTTVGFGFAADLTVADRIQAGDQLRIDNSAYLALETYHRHQVPPAGSELDHSVYDQFRGPDGTPIYPQRSLMVGPIGATNASGAVNNGDFDGKMIVIENLLDGDALPWQADWYRAKVEVVKAGGVADTFRLWFTDNAQHMQPSSAVQETHVTSYRGQLEQGLRDLSAWVEKGVQPPASTAYEVVDGQVKVPATARDRKGIQPVVEVQANGGERAEVVVGEPVTFTAEIVAPPGTGEVVGADWDFLGDGSYPIAAQVSRLEPGAVRAAATYTVTQPGTYFPALRAASQRDADPDTPYARAQNLGRVRVVVSSAREHGS